MYLFGNVDLVDDQQVGFGDTGAALAATLSPAKASITYRVRSVSSGLKVAERLSSPDSTSSRSR